LLEVKKSNNSESTASLLRRFKFKIRQTGILTRAKSIRYRSKSLSKYKKKQAALQRIKNQEHYEYLRKLGKAK
jgi:ribosomal protein S21